MKLLFELDSQNYSDEMPVYERKGVRGIIIKNGKLAMQYSEVDGEYKIPGGGIESGESHMDALKREVREETGLFVKEESVEQIGQVIEKRQDLHDPSKKFIQYSYYYKCDVTDETVPLSLTESEIKKGYSLVWETPEKIYENNMKLNKEAWLLRDTMFIKMIIDGKIKF